MNSGREEPVEVIRDFMFGDEEMSPHDHITFLKQFIASGPTVENIEAADNYRRENLEGSEEDINSRIFILAVASRHTKTSLSMGRSNGLSPEQVKTQTDHISEGLGSANIALDTVRGFHDHESEITFDRAFVIACETIKVASVLSTYEYPRFGDADVATIEEELVSETLYFTSLASKISDGAPGNADRLLDVYNTFLSVGSVLENRPHLKNKYRAMVVRKALSILPHTSIPAEEKITASLNLLEEGNGELVNEAIAETIEAADASPRHIDSHSRHWFVKKVVDAELPSEREEAISVLVSELAEHDENIMKVATENPALFTLVASFLSEVERSSFQSRVINQLADYPFIGSGNKFDQAKLTTVHIAVNKISKDSPETAQIIRDRIKSRMNAQPKHYSEQHHTNPNITSN